MNNERPFNANSHVAALPTCLEFYQKSWPEVISAVRHAGTLGAELFTVAQGAGDWSDEPTRNLMINILRKTPVDAALDLGSGRFGGIHQPNGFIVVSPGTATQITVEAPHELLLMSLPYGRLHELWGGPDMPEDGDFGRLHRMQNFNPMIVQLGERLWIEALSGASGTSLKADSMVLQIVAELLQMSARFKGRAIGGLSPWQERRCKEAIGDQLEHGLTLTELAALAGLSTYHFCRAFAKSTGLTPHRYQLAMRVEKAASLLRDTDIDVTEIALAVGYGSSQAMARVFKQQLGTSPSQYRREMLQ